MEIEELESVLKEIEEKDNLNNKNVETALKCSISPDASDSEVVVNKAVQLSDVDSIEKIRSTNNTNSSITESKEESNEGPNEQVNKKNSLKVRAKSQDCLNPQRSTDVHEFQSSNTVRNECLVIKNPLGTESDSQPESASEDEQDIWILRNDNPNVKSFSLYVVPSIATKIEHM